MVPCSIRSVKKDVDSRERYVYYRDMRNQSAAVQAFLAELAEVCRRHNLSLSHEDTEGAFRVQSFDECNIDWLKAAFDETGEEA